MEHIDQKILELYVLNDESVRPQHDRIESHLAECAGCRELYARMEAVYADFSSAIEDDATFERSPDHRTKSRRSLSLTTISPLQQIHANYEIDRIPIRQVAVFTKKHPIIAGSISFFILGFFALLGLQLFNASEKVDDNPSYYRYTIDDKLEVYNSKNELLWFKFGKDLEAVRNNESISKAYQTQVVDIDKDGSSEVISTLLLEPEKELLRNGITVFDKYGKIKKKFFFSEKEFQFRNLNYDTPFTVGWFFCDIGDKNEFNLFVTASNGRSPSFLARLDSNFNIIGRYWNFGQFQFLPMTLSKNKKVIALIGKNDIDDYALNDFSMLAILDPEHLQQEEESSTSRGFGFKRSKSELYYIKLPESDITQALHLKQIADQSIYIDSLVFYVNTKCVNSDVNISFDYVFNKSDMSVKTVKFNTGTERLHAKLKSEGKLRSVFDERYLDNLKNNVEYWDGNKWINTPIKINRGTN